MVEKKSIDRGENHDVIEVTVCVGSSCHIKGSRRLIEQLNKLITKYHLEDNVILKGSFCLEHCAEGFNWKIGDTLYSSKDVTEAEKIFRQKVIEALTGMK